MGAMATKLHKNTCIPYKYSFEFQEIVCVSCDGLRVTTWGGMDVTQDTRMTEESPSESLLSPQGNLLAKKCPPGRLRLLFPEREQKA